MKLSFEGTQEEILATLKAICRSDSVVNNYSTTVTSNSQFEEAQTITGNSYPNIMSK